MMIGVLQPGYLPWLGFFEQMSKVEVFVLYDDVQYTKKDWRNRNRVKGPDGEVWLTVPVLTAGRFEQLICDTMIANEQPWARKHWKTLEGCYSKAPYFNLYADELRAVYEQRWSRLLDLDFEAIGWICEKLGLNRKIILSSELGLKSTDRNLRIVEICKKLGSNWLYEGEAAKSHLDLALFEKHGIRVEFQDYEHPYYNQLWMKRGFISHLSVIDLLFNHGPESLDILANKVAVSPLQDRLVSAPTAKGVTGDPKDNPDGRAGG